MRTIEEVLFYYANSYSLNHQARMLLCLKGNLSKNNVNRI